MNHKLPKPALWHDPETGHWKKLTKPDRPTYEAFYSVTQMEAAYTQGRKEALEDVEKELLRSFGMYVAVEVVRSMK